MGVMTLGTPHAGMKHLALQVRAIDVDFIKDLTVGMVQPIAEDLRHKIIEQRPAVLVVHT